MKRLTIIALLMIITSCILKVTPAKADDAASVKYITGPFDNSYIISEYHDGGFTTFYKQNEKSEFLSDSYGIIDNKGREVINCSFIQLFSENLAAFAFYDIKGYMNKEGNVVISPQFGWAEQFNEGFAAISGYNETGEKWGYIDKTGKKIVTPKYDYAGNFHEGMATVGISNNNPINEYKYGVINNEGKEVLKPDYDAVINYFDGLAIIVSNGKYGCVDRDGKIVIKCQYDYISDYSGGLALAGYFNKKQQMVCVLLDRDGKKVSNKYYDYKSMLIKRHYGGYYLYSYGEIPTVEGLIQVSRNSRYGFVDKNGREVIELKYDFADPFSDGLARVGRDGKQFLIDTKGNELVELKRYYECSNGPELFCEGLMRVCENNKWGYIDKAGNEIVGLDFDYVSDFHQGLALVAKEGKQGFISNPLDVPDNWARDHVLSAIDSNLVPAYLQYGYKDNINRRDFSSLIITLIEQKTGKSIDTILSEKKLDISNNSFVDVNDKDTDVFAANRLGITKGIGGGLFCPDGEITRQEAAVMLSRAAEALGMNISETSAQNYSDSSKIQDWAKAGVDFVSFRGIMTGIGGSCFDPTGKFTKQQAFITMLRMLNAG